MVCNRRFRILPIFYRWGYLGPKSILRFRETCWLVCVKLRVFDRFYIWYKLETETQWASSGLILAPTSLRLSAIVRMWIAQISPFYYNISVRSWIFRWVHAVTKIQISLQTEWRNRHENSFVYSHSEHYATNRQVAGSIPDGVIGIFQWHSSTGRTMALGSTQPLTELSTRCISWG